MIERYSRPAMKEVWSDAYKFKLWLDIELACCEAWTELGVIPRADMAKLRKAKFSPEHYAEIFKVTHHDVTAFLRSVGMSLGKE